ncbi:MAG: chromosome partitioning protein [Proteobacteria bacterium]|nr:MAG: chromosome partitioning protein [Pseudomonadota bacterium]PIE40180.1 MAG: chromosome partitioning protein [Gammaproteobacteria bacterium]
MKSIAFYNLKGGVGKTAAAVNIAYLAAKDGIPTLLWDMDPQGSTSWYFRHTPDRNFKLSHLLKKKYKLGKMIEKTDFPRLDIIPSGLSIRNADIDFDSHGKSRTLQFWLDSLSKTYGLVVFDCAPNISNFSESLFNAIDLLYVPMIPSHLSMQTYEKISCFFDESGIKAKKLRPFFSLVDRRKSLHREFLANPPIKLRKQLSGFIPYASHIEQMGTHRKPVFEFAPRSAGALAYRLLWHEEIKNQLKL